MTSWQMLHRVQKLATGELPSSHPVHRLVVLPQRGNPAQGCVREFAASQKWKAQGVAGQKTPSGLCFCLFISCHSFSR
jgi:hypothetical protein